MALWSAAALAALRVGVLFGMARFAHGEQLQLVWMRLASTLPATLVTACLIAASWSLLGSALWARAQSSIATRRLTLTVVWLTLTVPALLLCVGRLSSDRSLRVGLDTTSGRMAWMAILLVSALLAALLLLLLVRPPAIWARASVGVVLPVLLALCGIGALELARRAGRGELTVREVVGELLLDEEALEVVHAREDEAPSFGVLCPSPSFRVDRADLPACVLPPPAEVRFQVPGGTGPLWLSARAGVDARALGRADLAAARVRFELELDGSEHFRWEAELGPERTAETNG